MLRGSNGTEICSATWSWSIVPPSTLRAERLRKIRRLKAQGKSSSAIGREIGIAPSTVRDYLSDPNRERARKRQLSYAVDPAVNLNGGQVTALHPSAKFTPHKGRGKVHNAARSRQARALIGWGHRKG